MAKVLRIREVGDPILSMKCDNVTEITRGSTRQY